ncbi:MAG: EcsC family protein [Paenibacillaceae bacterium]
MYVCNCNLFDFGAAVGAWANYSIVEELGKYTMNGYRIRRLADETFFYSL